MKEGLFPRLSDEVVVRGFREQILVHHARYGTQLQANTDHLAVLESMDGQHSIEDMESILVEARGTVAYQELAVLLYQLWDRGMLENEEEVRAALFEHHKHRTLDRALAWRRVRSLFGWSMYFRAASTLMSFLAPLGKSLCSVPFYGLAAGLFVGGWVTVWQGAVEFPDALFLQKIPGQVRGGSWVLGFANVYAAAVLVMSLRGLARAAVLSGPGNGLKGAGLRWSAGVIYLDVDDREAFHLPRDLNLRFGLTGLAVPAMCGGLFAMLASAGMGSWLAAWTGAAWLILFLDLCPFLPTDGARLVEVLTAVNRQRYRVRTFIRKRLVRGMAKEGEPGTGAFRVVAICWILWFMLALQVFSDFFLGQIYALQLTLMGDAGALEMGVGGFLFVYLLVLVATLLSIGAWFLVSFSLQVFEGEHQSNPHKSQEASALGEEARSAVVHTLSSVELVKNVSEDTLNKLVDHMDHLHFKAGAWIHRAKLEGDRLYWVQSGRVDLLLPKFEGGHDFVASLGLGENFGAMDRLGLGSPHDARAAEETQVLALDVQALEHVLSVDDEGAGRVKENLELAVFLDGIPEMAGLGNSGRLSLAGKVEIKEFEEGAHIVQEGEAADCLYLIRDGQCVVWRKAEDGAEEVLAKLGPGQTFGEIGLLFQKPRSATVTCLEPTTVIEASRTALDQALRQSFHVGLALERLARIRLDGAA